MSSTQVQPPPLPKTVPTESTKAQPKPPQAWNVVLLNDEEHTYQYVIRMLQTLFAQNRDKALKTAQTVDKDGRAVCLTTHKEHAELKRDQILGFGRDHLMAECKGSMTSIIEPAEFEGDEGKGSGQ